MSLSVQRILSFDVGIRNLSWCLIELRTTPESIQDPWKNIHIIQWECIDVLTDNKCKAKSAKTVNAERCTRFMLESLRRRIDSFAPLEDLQVLIEQQPLQRRGIGSAKNKILGHVIYTVFYGVSKSIQFYNSKKKLAVNLRDSFYVPNRCKQTPREKAEQKKNLNKAYRNRKKLAIQYATTVMEKLDASHNGFALERWETYCRKRDDLADCLLQALHYLQSQN